MAAWRRWVAALAAVGVAAGGLGSVWAAGSAPKVVSVAGVSCLSRRAPFVCWAPPGRSTLTVTLAAGSPSVTWYPEFYGPLAAMQPVVTNRPTVYTWRITFTRPTEMVLLTAASAPPAVTIYGGLSRFPATPSEPLRVALPTRNLAMPAGTQSPQQELDAILAAHREEGVPGFSLPRNFRQLTPPEQLFVLANLERVTRGLWPLYGVDRALNVAARVGAEHGVDPQWRPNVAWGSNWAGGSDVLASDFLWMYDDGPGSENLACTVTNRAGCWGHRRNILGNYGPFGLFGGALVVGGKAPYGEDATELFLSNMVPPKARLVYTWADAVAAGARPAR